jgi:hypothetical protein
VFTDHTRGQFIVPAACLKTLATAPNGQTLRFWPERSLLILVEADGHHGQVHAASEALDWCRQHGLPAPATVFPVTTTTGPVTPETTPDNIARIGDEALRVRALETWEAARFLEHAIHLWEIWHLNATAENAIHIGNAYYQQNIARQAIDVLYAHGAAIPSIRGRAAEEVLSWFPRVPGGAINKEQDAEFIRQVKAMMPRLRDLQRELGAFIDRVAAAPLSALAVREGHNSGSQSPASPAPPALTDTNHHTEAAPPIGETPPAAACSTTAEKVGRAPRLKLPAFFPWAVGQFIPGPTQGADPYAREVAGGLATRVDALLSDARILADPLTPLSARHALITFRPALDGLASFLTKHLGSCSPGFEGVVQPACNWLMRFQQAAMRLAEAVQTAQDWDAQQPADRPPRALPRGLLQTLESVLPDVRQMADAVPEAAPTAEAPAEEARQPPDAPAATESAEGAHPPPEPPAPAPGIPEAETDRLRRLRDGINTLVAKVRSSCGHQLHPEDTEEFLRRGTEIVGLTDALGFPLPQFPELPAGQGFRLWGPASVPIMVFDEGNTVLGAFASSVEPWAAQWEAIRLAAGERLAILDSAAAAGPGTDPLGVAAPPVMVQEGNPDPLAPRPIDPIRLGPGHHAIGPHVLSVQEHGSATVDVARLMSTAAHNSPATAPALTAEQGAVLLALEARYPSTVLQVDLEAMSLKTLDGESVNLDRKTIGRCLKELRVRGLARRPHGDRKGDAITEAGRKLIACRRQAH